LRTLLILVSKKRCQRRAKILENEEAKSFETAGIIRLGAPLTQIFLAAWYVTDRLRLTQRVVY